MVDMAISFLFTPFRSNGTGAGSYRLEPIKIILLIMIFALVGSDMLSNFFDFWTNFG